MPVLVVTMVRPLGCLVTTMALGWLMVMMAMLVLRFLVRSGHQNLPALVLVVNMQNRLTLNNTKGQTDMLIILQNTGQYVEVIGNITLYRLWQGTMMSRLVLSLGCGTDQ